MADSSPGSKKLRVLVLATSYPLGPKESSSVFLRYLYEHVYRRGAEVHVLAPAATNGGSTVENGIHVHRFRYIFKPFQKLCYGSGILPNLKRNPLLWVVVPFFLTYFLLAALLTTLRVNPNLIHGHWVVPTGVIGLLVSKIFEIPFVITAHGGDAFAVKSGLMTRTKRFVIRHTQVWTANTAATAAAIASSGKSGNLHIIPMGVDARLFVPDPGQRNQSIGKKRILFIGRLVEKKGVAVLLEAIARLPDDIRDCIRVDIVGEGDEKAGLQQMADKLAIESVVNFEGHVANEELPRFLQQADLFVGPSIVDSVGDTEGMGVVFLEAMACGVPVIASDVGGISEVIEDGVTGILVPAGDTGALAAAIENLLGDDAKRLSLAQRGRAQIEEHYSWDSVSARFITLYSELVKISAG